MSSWSLDHRSALLLILVISIAYGLASFLYYYSTPYYNSYISDEVWYVDAARNLLYLLGLEPRLTEPYTATIFLRPEADTQEFLSILNTSFPEVKVVQTLSKIKAVYVESHSLRDIERLSLLPEIKYIRPGYVYGDAGDIDVYYNLEHPPLAKYFIMYSMYLFGDDPFFWRLPSIILGVLKVFLVGVLILRLTNDPLFGILGSLTVLFDPINVFMDGLAMLEAYVSFFTVLAAVFICLENHGLAGLFTGLASSAKMSGFFISLPGLLLSITRRNLKKSIVYYIFIPLAVFILTNIPIMLLFGYERWWRESIVGALSWHLSTKTKPGEGPPISTPWDWFLGANPFYVTINPDTPIRGNIIIYIGTIILSILFLVLIIAYREEIVKKYTYVIYMMTIAYGTWFGYVIIWFAGNHSEYSFYMAQISPLLDALFVLLLYVFYKEYAKITRLVQDLVLEQKSIKDSF